MLSETTDNFAFAEEAKLEPKRYHVSTAWVVFGVISLLFTFTSSIEYALYQTPPDPAENRLWIRTSGIIFWGFAAILCFAIANTERIRDRFNRPER